MKEYGWVGPMGAGEMNFAERRMGKGRGMKTPTPATPQPEVTVRIPEVRLQLQDIAYMRSLGSDGVHCVVAENTRHRLQLLGLIAKQDVLPTAEVLIKARDEMREAKVKLAEIVKAQQWDDLSNHGYTLRRVRDRMLPTKQWALTDAGRKLLSNGEIKVKMMKTGCGK